MFGSENSMSGRSRVTGAGGEFGEYLEEEEPEEGSGSSRGEYLRLGNATSRG
jgi:hypothetical protein